MIYKYINIDLWIRPCLWQYCVILNGAKIGDRCNICANCSIENNVIVGNNVTVKCRVQLRDGITVEDNVFIGPNVTFCNDRYPRSKNQNFKPESILIKHGASIGANSTILSGTIPKHSRFECFEQEY